MHKKDILEFLTRQVDMDRYVVTSLYSQEGCIRIFSRQVDVNRYIVTSLYAQVGCVRIFK